MTWASITPAITAAFLASLVESVEALTIVLAVATVRGWRPAGLGALIGLMSLGLIFTRLTNAFSKKIDNHIHMVAIYSVWYNYVRQHKTHRLSPAMAAGISDKLWSMTDLAEMIDSTVPKPGKRGPYKRATLENG